jgi:hypothetical protein
MGYFVLEKFTDRQIVYNLDKRKNNQRSPKFKGQGQRVEVGKHKEFSQLTAADKENKKTFC